MGFLDVIRAPQPVESRYDQQIRLASDLTDSDRLVQVGTAITQRVLGEMGRTGAHEVLTTYNSVALEAASQTALTEVEGRALVNAILEDMHVGLVTAQRTGIEGTMSALNRFVRDVVR